MRLRVPQLRLLSVRRGGLLGLGSVARSLDISGERADVYKTAEEAPAARGGGRGGRFRGGATLAGRRGGGLGGRGGVLRGGALARGRGWRTVRRVMYVSSRAPWWACGRKCARAKAGTKAGTKETYLHLRPHVCFSISIRLFPFPFPFALPLLALIRRRAFNTTLTAAYRQTNNAAHPLTQRHREC